MNENPPLEAHLTMPLADEKSQKADMPDASEIPESLKEPLMPVLNGGDKNPPSRDPCGGKGSAESLFDKYNQKVGQFPLWAALAPVDKNMWITFAAMHDKLYEAPVAASTVSDKQPRLCSWSASEGCWLPVLEKEVTPMKLTPEQREAIDIVSHLNSEIRNEEVLTIDFCKRYSFIELAIVIDRFTMGKTKIQRISWVADFLKEQQQISISEAYESGKRAQRVQSGLGSEQDRREEL